MSYLNKETLFTLLLPPFTSYLMFSDVTWIWACAFSMNWKHHEPDPQMLVWLPSVGSCDMIPQPLKDEKLEGQMEERLARRKCVLSSPYFSLTSSLSHLNGMREAGLINSEQNEFNHFVVCIMIHTPSDVTRTNVFYDHFQQEIHLIGFVLLHNWTTCIKQKELL